MRSSRRSQEKSRYATSVDFRQIFAAETDGLYQLAFVLTGTAEKAEKTFVTALEDALHSSYVIKQRAHSWAKRLVIQNSIHLVQPRLTDSGLRTALTFSDQERSEIECSKIHFDLSSVLSLAPFERFVFVITVLERHSDQECALLLNCLALEVRQARANALEQLATTVCNEESAVPQPDRLQKGLELSVRNEAVVR